MTKVTESEVVSLTIGTRTATMTYQPAEEIGLTYRIHVKGSTELTKFCDADKLITEIYENMEDKPSKLTNLGPKGHYEFSISPKKVPSRTYKILVLLTALEGCSFAAPGTKTGPTSPRTAT